MIRCNGSQERCFTENLPTSSKREYLYRVDTIRYNKYYLLMARGIQAEIKQAKTFSSLEEEALSSLQRTAAQLQWRISELLKPYGISPTQYTALRSFRGAKGRGPACSEIAKRRITRDPEIAPRVC